MKICFSSFTCPQWSLAQMIEAARGYGYHGLELRCDVGHQHGVEVGTSPEQRVAIREQLLVAGVEVPCLSTSVQFAHRHADDILAGRVNLARDLGVPAVRALCGHSEDALELHDTLEVASSRLRKAARYALSQDIQIWIETHDIVAKGVHCASLLRQAEYDNIGIVYNNLHPFRAGEKVNDTLSHIARHIRMVHFHDGMNDPDKVIITPMRHGQMPVDDTFASLVNFGFNGYISGEWFNQQYGHDYDESIARYMQDMKRLAEKHQTHFEPVYH